MMWTPLRQGCLISVVAGVAFGFTETTILSSWFIRVNWKQPAASTGSVAKKKNYSLLCIIMHLQWNTTYGDNTEFVQFPNRTLYNVCNRKRKRISLSLTFYIWLCAWNGCVKVNESHSVMSDSLRAHGLYGPRNSPGQNTGVGSLSLLQGIFPSQGSNPGLLHCRWILSQLSHKGSPKMGVWSLIKTF